MQVNEAQPGLWLIKNLMIVDLATSMYHMLRFQI